jgi:hypothetical protein
VSGNNFITNPGGSGSRGKGRDFSSAPAVQQKSRDSVADRSTKDAAAGGLLPLVQAGPAHNAGVGSIGNGQKPFRLGGG